MQISEIQCKVTELKRSQGKLSTNYYFGALSTDSVDDYYENEGAIVFGVKGHFKTKYYYYYADVEAFSELLKEIPIGSIIEIISKDEDYDNEAIFDNTGWEKYAKFVRLTMWWNTNPFEYPEEGRRKILQDMYNPERGEIATKGDIKELSQIVEEKFDSKCDEVFTDEEWNDIIERKNCILYREYGEIIAFYIWRLEGKKLYSNMSVNKGPANLLYDMERRIFTKYWSQGIRVSYAWFNITNKTALRRGNQSSDKLMDRKDIIYNHMYIKK